MSILIRKATQEDLDAVVAIENEGLKLWDRNQFLAELRLGFSDFIVLEEPGTIAGFAVSWNVSDEIQLNNIGVRADRRNRGLGTALLERIMAPPARPVPARKIVLEVNSANPAAVCFYEKNGFTATGLRKKFYKDGDAILMEKKLPC